MSDSVQPRRRQPTRLPHPWDSPGKNTGVGCHFRLRCMKVKSESEVTQSCPTLATPWTAAYQAPLSMGFSRRECWSGVPLSSPNILSRTLISGDLVLRRFSFCRSPFIVKRLGKKYPLGPGTVSISLGPWLQPLSCIRLFCNPMDHSPSGSSLHGIFQARMLERLPFPTSGKLPDLGVEPLSCISCINRQILHHCATWEAYLHLG